MNTENLLSEASVLYDKLLEHRRFLHTHPEIGFELKETYQYVYDALVSMGYAPHAYGKCGLIAICGHKEKGKTILLRADMDALAIKEEADISYPSTNGNMHACGHDMHTTMLLGAAQLLKNHEDDLVGAIVLCFQPSEETLEGAKNMIVSGVLRDTTPDAALMIHITVGMPFDTGTIVICDGGISAPAADYFEIKIQGKGCHGAMPQMGVDPITVAAHIVTALQEIHARELSMADDAVLTIGKLHAGNASNVIPDDALLGGTIRAYTEETRSLIKTRMEEIITGMASLFRANATLTFTSECPTLLNDEQLSKDITKYMKELLGPQKAFTKSELTGLTGNIKVTKATGSEDFAYFSHEMPSIMLAIAVGKPEDGYIYPLHHPKAKFDEASLSIGSAVYAYSAIRWLEEHSK